MNCIMRIGLQVASGWSIRVWGMQLKTTDIVAKDCTVHLKSAQDTDYLSRNLMPQRDSN